MVPIFVPIPETARLKALVVYADIPSGNPVVFIIFIYVFFIYSLLIGSNTYRKCSKYRSGINNTKKRNIRGVNWHVKNAALTISLAHSPAFIGCVFLNVSGPRLPSSCTRSFTAVHCRTLARSLTLPTFQVAEDFALPAATASSSLQFTVLLLVAEPFRLLALRCGTACHWRLRRRHLWQPSKLNSRRFSLLNHILASTHLTFLCLCSASL